RGRHGSCHRPLLQWKASRDLVVFNHLDSLRCQRGLPHGEHMAVLERQGNRFPRTPPLPDFHSSCRVFCFGLLLLAMGTILVGNGLYVVRSSGQAILCVAPSTDTACRTVSFCVAS